MLIYASSLLANDDMAIDKLPEIKPWYARRPLIFIGDSVTRYQYMTLAYKIINDIYESDSPLFNISKTFTNEHNFDGWDVFHSSVNAMWGQGMFLFVGSTF